jgi:DtxR family transcriptional regulator, Mn-dependent transcriptional regulator
MSSLTNVLFRVKNMNKISSTIEDYLGLLYISERDGDDVNGSRLSELLGVSAPTVTNTLKRMTRDGLISMDQGHTPHLTEAGALSAKSVMRKHMLAEWMLLRMLSWSKVHHEAHGFEHAISEEVEIALLRDFHQPEVCPHGNPLPGHELAVADWVPLLNISPGETVIVRRIHELAEETPQLLEFLEEKGISPGTRVKVSEILHFNQTLTLLVNSEPVTLGFATAQYLYVET